MCAHGPAGNAHGARVHVYVRLPGIGIWPQCAKGRWNGADGLQLMLSLLEHLAAWAGRSEQ